MIIKLPHVHYRKLGKYQKSENKNICHLYVFPILEIIVVNILINFNLSI